MADVTPKAALTLAAVTIAVVALVVFGLRQRPPAARSGSAPVNGGTRAQASLGQWEQELTPSGWPNPKDAHTSTPDGPAPALPSVVPTPVADSDPAREAATIFALVDQGAIAEARARASRFLLAHAGSPLAAEVARRTGVHPPPPVGPARAAPPRGAEVPGGAPVSAP